VNEFPILRSARLILRAFKLNDASVVQRLAGDFAIADTTSTIPHPYPDGAAEDWISTHESVWMMDRAFHWAIVTLAASTCIGAVSLSHIDRDDNHAEIGYWIGKPYWGKGYCTEAARRVVEFAFEEMNLNRIYAYHFTRNPASGRVMQKIGMRQEGLLQQHTKRWDKYEDLALYAILKSEIK
jgi:[ribosomal protein S5]-alanine N-acetyltransferase